MAESLVRAFIRTQVRLCRLFDKLLPKPFGVDGNTDFRERIVPQFLGENMVVYDMGGGRCPLINLQRKTELNLKVFGLDIDTTELAFAPEGAYDAVICADITQYRGKGDADIVICQAVLEHVPDPAAAFLAIAGTLKPGGVALIFAPCRNAIFARLNLLVPERLKRTILYAIFPEKREKGGFRAYYRQCTPRDFLGLAKKSGFKALALRSYFMSSYFSFFFPLYLFWRVWILASYITAGSQAAETFSLALRKT